MLLFPHRPLLRSLGPSTALHGPLNSNLTRRNGSGAYLPLQLHLSRQFYLWAFGLILIYRQGTGHWVSIRFISWHSLYPCSNVVTGPTFRVSAFSSTRGISDGALDYIHTTYIAAQSIRIRTTDDIADEIIGEYKMRTWWWVCSRHQKCYAASMVLFQYCYYP